MKPELDQAFPKLGRSEHEATSVATYAYNCIAWAAGDTSRWWCPEAYWPEGVEPEFSVAALEKVYGKLGYAPCAGPSFEPGLEKVAIYARDGEATHAARQLASGLWTSKLGGDVDISHEIGALDGPLYGSPVRFLARERQA